MSHDSHESVGSHSEVPEVRRGTPEARARRHGRRIVPDTARQATISLRGVRLDRLETSPAAQEARISAATDRPESREDTVTAFLVTMALFVVLWVAYRIYATW